VEPGEYATSFDEGVTAGYDDAYRVAPVTVLDESECLSKDDARAELGLGPNECAVLITLGAGNINAIDSTVRALVDSVRALPEPWTVFLTKAPIAVSDQTFVGVREISEYPLARVARAFDFAVSASGYNSYHEWVQLGLPTLWLPNTATSTDDQIARGRYAESVGAGLCLVEPDENEIQGAISDLAQDQTRERMRQVMAETSFVNGAAEIAELLEELAR
jgi:UDP:flavonoid glycosyltransferase YjiC (YdhE family)